MIRSVADIGNWFKHRTLGTRGILVAIASAPGLVWLACEHEESPSKISEEEFDDWWSPIDSPARVDPDMAFRVQALEDRRTVYVQYLRHRMEDGDWHGVMDAAADLREIDAELRVLRTLTAAG